jgi:hypothetical protein
LHNYETRPAKLLFYSSGPVDVALLKFEPRDGEERHYKQVQSINSILYTVLTVPLALQAGLGAAD